MANRPFDLKAALSGEPVLFNHDEYAGNIYHFKRITEWEGERCMEFDTAKPFMSICTDFDGAVFTYNKPLTMAPRKIKTTVYVNLYGGIDGGGSFTSWRTSDFANAVAIKELGGHKRLAVAVPVEIEVEE